jgi:hypothetical protein
VLDGRENLLVRGTRRIAPQTLLYIYDLLHWTDEESEADQVQELDS